MIIHIKDPNSDKCIVFIHGLGGGLNTFSKFSSYLNSKWNFNYGIILHIFGFYRKMFYYKAPLWVPNLLISMIGYVTFPLKACWSRRNSHNVKLLDEYIVNNCANSNNVVLVAHSMGGLIARQYLVDSKKNGVDIRKIRMLCTYATPHNGSHIANYATFLTRLPIIKKIYIYFTNVFKYRIFPQIGDLSNLNEFIKKLNEEWRDFQIDNDLLFIRIGGTKDWLVKTNSSNLNNDDINNVFYYPSTHSGIISPSEEENEFPPIDKFFEKLASIEDFEEYNEELQEEINYEDDYESDDY